MKKSLPPLSTGNQSAVVSFEWMAHVHEIFNNILMDIKQIVIDSKNIQYTFLSNSKTNSLGYFESLRCKQLRRRDAEIDNWQITLLDVGKTWSNLRMTCRGFIKHCRATIKYARANDQLIPKCHGISVAHLNLGVLEAWLSLVCRMKLDLSTGYESAVGNKLMRSTSAPKTTEMCCTRQAGETVGDKAICPTAIISYHATHQESMLELFGLKAHSEENSMSSPTRPFSCFTLTIFPERV
jgi:hypothetical protein